MKFCQKCGKEIMDEAVVCPGCGCAVGNEVKRKEVSYDVYVSSAVTTNILSAVILSVGVVCALFVNVWIGAVLCLVAEIIAVTPNSRLQKALKNNNKLLDKEALKGISRQCVRDFKFRYPAFRVSFILAYISLACLIVFALLGNGLGV